MINWGQSYGKEGKKGLTCFSERVCYFAKYPFSNFLYLTTKDVYRVYATIALISTDYYKFWFVSLIFTQQTLSTQFYCRVTKSCWFVSLLYSTTKGVNRVYTTIWFVSLIFTKKLFQLASTVRRGPIHHKENI